MASRGLVTEFPTVPDGYESRLAIGRDSAPARGREILRVLLGLNAPAHVTADARLWLDRLSIVGTSLGATLVQNGAKTLADSINGKTTVLYTWRVADVSSQRRARSLASSAPSITIIGINLDIAHADAAAFAAREKLPGLQYYRQSAADATTVALKLDRPSLAYLTDKTGIIRDVNASAWFKEKVSTLGR
jgi:hypothetical protein